MSYAREYQFWRLRKKTPILLPVSRFGFWGMSGAALLLLVLAAAGRDRSANLLLAGVVAVGAAMQAWVYWHVSHASTSDEPPPQPPDLVDQFKRMRARWHVYAAILLAAGIVGLVLAFTLSLVNLLWAVPATFTGLLLLTMLGLVHRALGRARAKGTLPEGLR